MTQLSLQPTTLADPVADLITVLERYRDDVPVLAEELARQQALSQTLAEQQVLADEALRAWRAALGQRWNCEIAAQRCYSQVLQQLNAYYGNAADGVHVLTTARGTDTVYTPTGLLQAVRRLEAGLALLTPAPAFAEPARAALNEVAGCLERAIADSTRCEMDRHALLVEQRLATSLIERGYQRSLRLLAHHASAEDVAGLPADLPTDRAA